MTSPRPFACTVSRALRPLTFALAGLALIAWSTATAGAQPAGGQPPGFNGAPPQGGQPGGPPAGFQDQFAATLAANLGLPVDTVKSALQQLQPDMPPPGQPPAFGGDGRPGGPDGPPGGGPASMPPGPGDRPAPGGDGSPPGPAGGPGSGEMATKLAAILGLPATTVSTALQQTFQQMGPPGGPGGFQGM